MQVIRESSLGEYARHFWQRERMKKDPPDKDALAAIANGGDPVQWLSLRHRYKLPRPDNDVVRIALLDQQDVETLLIHDYMPCGEWMKKSGLLPDPFTRNLKELATIAIARAYFARGEDDTQQAKYRDWISKRSLKDAISGIERVLIESVGSGLFEIVDGWGRLLPFASLLQQGHAFHPVESFVASQHCENR